MSNIHKILVAEDNEGNYFLMQSILKGFDVHHANNGKEAVEMSAAEHFDIILMDIKMPVMDGLEATRLIRERDKDIPIIAITANAFPSDEESALAAGCNTFIPKPVKKSEVLAAISAF